MPTLPPTLVLAAGPLAAEVSVLLGLAGWRVAEDHRDAEAGLVLGAGEPQAPEAWVREGLPHLAVVLRHAAARVGPFVAPGLTPCLRCVEAHEAAGRLGPPERLPTDGRLPLIALALGWALLDLEAWRAGRTPTTWGGATLTVETPGVVGRRVWPRHPHCGCGWGLAG